MSSLVSVIVNILKFFKKIPEGWGGRIFAGLNLLAFFVLVAFRIFAPQYSIEYLDGVAGKIAAVGLYITGYLFLLGSGQITYDILKKLQVPVLSHSDTLNPPEG